MRSLSPRWATDITATLGSLGIDPDSDTSGSRKVYAAFVELNMPVLKNLEINLAGRYDKYSDFGDTFNPKIGIRYQPTPELVAPPVMQREQYDLHRASDDRCETQPLSDAAESPN